MEDFQPYIISHLLPLKYMQGLHGQYPMLPDIMIPKCILKYHCISRANSSTINYLFLQKSEYTQMGCDVNEHILQNENYSLRADSRSKKDQ